MSAYTPTNRYRYAEYPNLREVLAPEYASLPPGEIEALMEGMFGLDSAERYEDYLEGIFGDIKRGIAKAAPAIATVGGGALKGALAGAPLGPAGIIAGAAAGGTGAALSKYGKGTARDIGGALSGVTGLAGQFSPAGRVGAAIGPAISGLAGGGGRGAAGAALGALGGLLGGGKGGAAAQALGSLLGGSTGGVSGALGALTSLFGGSGPTGQLLSLLQRPETMQALAALNLGPLGRRTVPVGSARTPVPATAIAGAIGELVEQAVDEAGGLSDGAEGELRYMTDEAGEFIGDPALDRDRAERVWDLLNVAQAERVVNAVAALEQAAEAYDETYREDLGEDYSEDYGEDLIEAYREELGEDLIEAYGEELGEDLIEAYGEWDESEPYEYV